MPLLPYLWRKDKNTTTNPVMESLTLVFSMVFVAIAKGEIGFITLDSLSFNKTVQAFPYAFVKFDSKSPGGGKHEAFVALAKELASQEKILLAEVRIPGFGSPENHELAERFELNQGILPEFILFKRKKLKGKTPDQIITRYGGAVDLDHMRRFLQLKTGISIGLPGCVNEFDELAATFTRNSGKDRFKIIQQTEELISKMNRENSNETAQIGKQYLKVMKIVTEKGLEFISTEEQRIEKLLEEPSKMAIEKWNELQKSLNRLKSFRKYGKKDEL